MPRHQSSASGFDAAQLTQIYRDHALGLRRRAFRYLRDDRAAEEIVQEAFVRMIATAPNIESGDHAIAYLTTSVTNLSLNRLRDAGRRPVHFPFDSHEVSEHLNSISSRSHRDQEFNLVEQARSDQVRAAISRLDRPLRIVLVMRDLQDRTVEEIAGQLLIKPNSVRTLLSRARAALREILEEERLSQDLRPSAGDFGLGDKRHA